MRIQETKIYQFSELSKESQARAIENQVRFLYQDDYMNEVIREGLIYEAQDMYQFNLEELELCYSLSSCQGDGVAFYGLIDSVKLLKLMDKLRYMERYSELFNTNYYVLLEKFELSLSITRNSFGYHYSHYETMTFEIDLDEIDSETHDFLYENLLEMVTGLEESFRIFFKELSKQLESSGYELIDDYVSEESARESIEANEYEFLASGEMA